MHPRMKRRGRSIGRVQGKPETTMQEATERVLSEVEGRTLMNYRSCLRFWCEFLGEDTLLSQVTSDDLDDGVDKLKADGKKPNTIRAYLAALRRLYSSSRRRFNTPHDLEWPHVPLTMKTRYLTDQEASAIFVILSHGVGAGKVTDERALDLFLVLIDTGFRLMEAVNLPWHSVDLDRKIIEVYRTKTGTSSMVPMSDRVHQVLMKRRHQKKPFERMENGIKRLREVIHAVCNGNTRLVETRGKATIHSLRDTYATRLRKKGMSLENLAKLLGHSHTAMTAKYAHIEAEDVMAEARALLNRA